MKRCFVRMRTMWSVATVLPVGTPEFSQLTSAELLGTKTALAGAIINNTSISIDQVATHAKHGAGRPVC